MRLAARPLATPRRSEKGERFAVRLKFRVSSDQPSAIHLRSVSIPLRLVPIVLRLVRPVHGHTEIVSLLVREARELYTDFLEVQTGYFLIELLGQAIDGRLVEVLVGPEIQLGENLIREGVRHDETGMARGASQVH